MKLAVVSGAAKGIGRAIAMEFAQNGYDLAISTLSNEEKLFETKNMIEALGRNCIAVKSDMSSPKDCEFFFETILSKYKNIDVLVNNAGISYIGLIQDMSYEDWDRVIKNNLYSVFNTVKLAIPVMLSQGYGSIINISSVWGNVGASTEVAYSASKGGINAFTKASAKELAPSNIQVNAIAAGLIDTEMNSFLNAEDTNALLEEIPAGRMGNPSEVAKLALFLATKNSYLTGQVIGLDGGW